MSKTRRGFRPRPLPQRTCVACGAVSAKRELVRIVRSPDGEVHADPTGKASGRGAYLCLRADCWEVALKKKRLERSLSVPVSSQSLEQLRAFASERVPMEVSS